MSKLAINKLQQEILKLIINNPNMTRANLAKSLNINKSTASYLTLDLKQQQIITINRDIVENKRGNYVRINKDFQKILVVEFGPGIISFKIINLAQEQISITKIRAINEEEIYQAITSYLASLPIEIKYVVGIIHGIVDHQNYKIKSPFYTLSYTMLVSIFTKYNLKYYLENESNIYALGLKSYSKNDDKIMVSIQIHHGVGLGIMINQKLFRGKSGYAGEIGHISVSETSTLEGQIADINVLAQCSKICQKEITVKNVNEYYQSNGCVKEIIDNNLVLLAKQVQVFCLVLDPDEVIVNSNVYGKINGADQLLYREIQQDHVNVPKIKVQNYDFKNLLNGVVNLFYDQVI